MYQEMREVWAELTAPGAQFEIETVNVRGIPIRSYKLAPPNLRALWLASAVHGDRDYLVYEDQRWTYAQTHRQVAAIGAWLVAQGVRPGDRVAIAMRNYPEWLPCYWATVSIGAAVVGMNAWWVADEMRYALEDARPKVLIADGERLARIQEDPGMAADMILVGVRCDEDQGLPGVIPFAELIRDDTELPQVDIDTDSDACIFYTSGTTGRPKGAQQTHRGCIANLFSLAFAGALAAGVNERRGLPPGPNLGPDGDRQQAALLTTPLFHVTANNCAAYAATLNGGKLVHMYKWDAGRALELIERERITNLTGVPVMSRELISHPDFARFDTSSLVAVGGGGAQLQPDLVHKIDQTVATARPNTGYGMTETCGIITSVSGDFFVDKPDSAGPAMPCYEAACFDDDGRRLPDGQVGELWVRGAQVIRGYLNRPEATAETITDGWLHTGDIARIDEDGFIFIVDRKKDMVIRGGENVYCAEVESALFSHDDVAECSAFGVADDRLGEEVAAAVVLKPGARLSAQDLREHCRTRISAHKVPRYIWLLSEPLPRNASGKFLKRELRDSLDITSAA